MKKIIAIAPVRYAFALLASFGLITAVIGCAELGSIDVPPELKEIAAEVWPQLPIWIAGCALANDISTACLERSARAWAIERYGSEEAILTQVIQVLMIWLGQQVGVAAAPELEIPDDLRDLRESWDMRVTAPSSTP